MRRGFSLIELVLVIVIMGILAGVGALSYRPHRLENDMDFIAMVLNKTKYEGIGFDHRAFGGGEIEDSQKIGCIKLDRDSISQKYKSGGGEYKIKSDISGEYAGKVICFDNLGRVNEGNYTNPIDSIIDLNISYGKRSKTIKLLPQSGFIIKY